MIRKIFFNIMINTDNSFSVLFYTKQQKGCKMFLAFLFFLQLNGIQEEVHGTMDVEPIFSSRLSPYNCKEV